MIEEQNRCTRFYGWLVALLLLGSMASCSPKAQDKDQSIETWTSSHMEDADFIAQARLLIDSVAMQSPTEQEGFVRKMADVLCREQKENLAISIAAYPHGIDLSADGYSEIGHRLLTQLRLLGNFAPQLPISDEDRQQAKGLLVLFFESDCHTCHALVDELTIAYDSLQAKGISIVSIASDNDSKLYEEYAQQLRWKDKYCDYTSFNGLYFKSWGVAYVPILYYVTQTGIVSGQYKSLQELKETLQREDKIDPSVERKEPQAE